MIPVIFHIGPIPINSFGLMIVCCFFAGGQRLALSLQKAGEDPLLAEKMIFWGVLGGVGGARLNYVLTRYTDFLNDPFWTLFGAAGFVFYGGFICAVFAEYILLRTEGKPFLRFADITSPTLAIGYAVGRIGCHLSGDGDYGKVTDSLLGFRYELGVAPSAPGVFVHPTPMYESLLSLLFAWLLVSLERRNAFSDVAGRRFGIYLALAGIARFCIEFLRIEPIVYHGLTEAQLMSIVIIAVGLFLFLRRKPQETASRNSLQTTSA